MTRYEHLPIYKAAYDLFIAGIEMTKNFPKDYKYTLGENFHKVAMELIKLVYKANMTQNKKDIIKEILVLTHEIGVLIRASHDLRIISKNNFLSMIEKQNNIERQATGWLKSFE